METERLTLLYKMSYTVMRNVLHCYTECLTLLCGMFYIVIRNVLHCYANLAFASRLWKWLANSPLIYRTVLDM